MPTFYDETFFKTVKVNFSLIHMKNQAMKTYGVMEVQLHSFLTLELDGGGSASRLNRFNPEERVPPIPVVQEAG
jgi:hypothetical protein